MKNKLLMILSMSAIIVVLFSVIFYIRSTRPMAQAQKEAVSIAKEFADLQEVDKFYWFTREKTYFSLTGKNAKQEKIAVIIARSGGEVKTFKQKDGLTEAAAIKKIVAEYQPKKVLKASLGMYQDEPVWEVVTENDTGYFNYYLCSFKTGDLLKNIENV